MSGKGLVEFNDIKIIESEFGSRQNFLRGRNRPQAHTRWINARRRRWADESNRLKPQALGEIRLDQQHRRRPIVDPGGVAGRDGASVVLGKHRAQRCEFFDRRIWTRVFIGVNDDRPTFALSYLDRHDLGLELARCLRGRPLLLTFQGEAILIGAADVVLARDVLRRLTHRVGVIHLSQFRIRKPPPDRRVVHLSISIECRLRLRDDKRRTTHALDAAGNHHIAVTRLDHPRRDVDRIQAGSAEPINGATRDGLRKPGQQRGHPGHIAVVLPSLIRSAEVDILDGGRVDAGSLDHLADDQRGQVIRPDRRQRTAVSSDRGAEGRNNRGSSHGSNDSGFPIPPPF